MPLDRSSENVPRDAQLKEWFLAGGAIGVMITLLLAAGLHYDAVPSGVIVTLWPAAMVQLIDPKTIGSKVAVGLIAYGSNFLIYGLIAAVVDFTAHRLLRLQRNDSRPRSE